MALSYLLALARDGFQSLVNSEVYGSTETRRNINVECYTMAILRSEKRIGLESMWVT